VSDLVLTVKQCPTCEQTKPLSAFWRNSGNADGHHRYCKTCARPAIDRAIKARRELLGDEEFRRRQRRSVAMSRRRGTADPRPNQARTSAYQELGRRHPEELAAIVRVERQKLGLNPDSQRAVS
jgi:hypothetical protein